MTVSKAQICNIALSHIRSTDKTISNLDTDAGHVAVQCRIHYDLARQFVLADHAWNFATKRKALADIGSPPATWLYRYDYPSDCLKFRDIQNQLRSAKRIPFAIEDDGSDSGLCILTDEAEAVGIYTRDVTNVSLFSPGFTTALGWYLASELAIAIANDRQLQGDCLEIYTRTRAAADAVDSDESAPDAEADSPWDQARVAGGSDA